MLELNLFYPKNTLLGHPNALSDKIAVVSTTEPLGSGTHPTVIGTLTWAQLYDQVRLASHALRKLGVKPGDRVATYSASNAEVVIAFLAVSTVSSSLVLLFADIWAI